MVVDDEPDLRELLCSELQYHGAETVSAKDGNEAFQILQREKIDVIVSDVRMPGGDGIALVDKIRESRNHAHIKIFLVTGFADVTLETARRKGVVDILSKPIDWDALIEQIYRAVKG